MSSATRIVLGLLVGLAVGAVLAAVHVPALERVIPFAEPVGVLWLNALRMTVVPLVVALLITGIASAAESAATGRLAARTLVYFLLFLSATALLSAILVPAVLALWPVQAQAADALRAGLSHAATTVPAPLPLSEWFTHIVPTNPFAAAASNA